MLIYSQITWIAVAGSMIRGLLPFPDGRVLGMVLVGAMFLFPMAVAITVFRSSLSPEARSGVVLVQIGLSIAHLVALLPGVQ